MGCSTLMLLSSFCCCAVAYQPQSRAAATAAVVLLQHACCIALQPASPAAALLQRVRGCRFLAAAFCSHPRSVINLGVMGVLHQQPSCCSFHAAAFQWLSCRSHSSRFSAAACVLQLTAANPRPVTNRGLWGCRTLMLLFCCSCCAAAYQPQLRAASTSPVVLLQHACCSALQPAATALL